MAVGFHPGQDNPNFPEIDFGFRARCMFLRDEHLRQPARFRINLRAAFADIVTDRRIGQLRCPVLISECIEILPKHHIDRGLECPPTGALCAPGVLRLVLLPVSMPAGQLAGRHHDAGQAP